MFDNQIITQKLYLPWYVTLMFPVMRPLFWNLLVNKYCDNDFDCEDHDIHNLPFIQNVSLEY